MPSRAPWVWGGISGDHPLYLYLNERMADLEAYLRELHREVTFGPVSGSYLEVDLGRSTNTGTALPVAIVDLAPLVGEARPIAVTLVCFFGDLTVDVLSEGSSILTAGPVSLTDATPIILNARGDFLVEKIKGDISLEVVSIDGATVPEHVRSRVYLKNVSKVEPA